MVWTPDPLVPFAQSSYAGTQRFSLAPGASLVAVDWVGAGRAACGERWAFDLYSSRTEVHAVPAPPSTRHVRRRLGRRGRAFLRSSRRSPSIQAVWTSAARASMWAARRATPPCRSWSRARARRWWRSGCTRSPPSWLSGGRVGATCVTLARSSLRPAR